MKSRTFMKKEQIFLKKYIGPLGAVPTQTVKGRTTPF
jgi:hypothetical protein